MNSYMRVRLLKGCWLRWQITHYHSGRRLKLTSESVGSMDGFGVFYSQLQIRQEA